MKARMKQLTSWRRLRSELIRLSLERYPERDTIEQRGI